MNQKNEEIIIEDWYDVEESCPLEISVIVRYYRKFKSLLPSYINNENRSYVKNAIFKAREELDLFLVTSSQVLFDTTVLKNPSEEYLYSLMKRDLEFLILFLNKNEEILMRKKDNPIITRDELSISNISSYIKIMRSIANAIYQAFLKATKEYVKKGKTEEDFIYVFFQVFQITLSVLSGYSEEASKASSLKSSLGVPITPWERLRSDQGQEIINEWHKEETGQDLPTYAEQALQDPIGQQNVENNQEITG